MSGLSCAAAGSGALLQGGKGLLQGTANGKGKRPAGAAEGGEQRMGAAAALAAICAYEPEHHTVEEVSELAAALPLVDCSVGGKYIALLAPRGAMLCQGDNLRGHLGAGDKAVREGLNAPRLPWPAAAVRCGGDFGVALSREGMVCSWGYDGAELGRGGSGSSPAPVDALPWDDPVMFLDAGLDFAIAVTRAGDVYGWGSNRSGQLALGRTIRIAHAPQRVAPLCGRGLRRIACGGSFAIAETQSQVLSWGPPVHGHAHLQPTPLPPSGGSVSFPLRSLAAGDRCAAAADAAGRLWCLWQWGGSLTPGGLPAGEGVVRVTAGTEFVSVVVALTEEGRLWDCPKRGFCRRIAAADGPLLGLLPRGGPAAKRILLIPDSCGGKTRLRLFSRIAMRHGVPSDPVLGVLCGLMVHGDYITGELDAPFGCPASTR
eukprot:TRINITY_DN45733_c0_g3_i1.p1 TRINITY_DN45733_c0_g3~~TRINITY_DN45733_c0_g3_i1.p1  ORF type:complete len:451 (+),score=79.58 TRINITY_DN45733_c0_g3_i1:66-1355(+)